MLIQSHSLLAKLLGNILCQKTLSAWVPPPPLPCGLREGEGETTWRWAPEPTCQPPPLRREGKQSGSHSHVFPENQVCFVHTDG